MANEMRDRLVELMVEADAYDGYECKLCTDDHSCFRCYFTKLATHLIENGVIVPQWISVKDRLPETSGKYLVAYYSMQFKRYFLDLLYYHARDKDDYFYCAENYKQKIDYWMPLPELPQAEQKLKEMRGEQE